MNIVFADIPVATGLRACGRPLQTDRHGGLSLHLLLLALSSLLPALCFAAATAAPTDLGQGLAYLRVESLSHPLPAATPTALVLDLRYSTTHESSADTLKAFLAARPANAALFILVSPDTPAALAPIIAASPALTLGAPDSVPAPKVVVATTAASDRRAYNAFTSGTPLAQLLSGKITKERYDEATLVKDFKAGVPEAAPPPPPNPTKSEVSGTATEPTTAKPAPPESVTDRVLQRAVHLHAAQRALKPRS